MHRILRKDLERFVWFAQTFRHPSEPDSEKGFPGRFHVYPWWNFENKLRPWVGYRAAYRLTSHAFLKRIFARQVARKLLSTEPTLLESRMLVCPQAEITVRVLHELSRKQNLSYITWIMDDHVLRWKNECWQYPTGYEPLFAQHLKQAEKVYVISHTLKNFYHERFGVNSEVLCGPANQATTQTSFKRPSDGPLRLAYFGSLGRWQNDALAIFANELGDQAVTLDLYSRNPEDAPPELVTAGARFLAPVAAHEVISLMVQYDALVLPVSFKNELRNMSVFNIATKFAEYFASNVPVLLIAPSDAAMVQMAKSYNAGVILNQACPHELRTKLAALQNEDLRAMSVTNGNKMVNLEFSHNEMQKRWNSGRQFLFGD